MDSLKTSPRTSPAAVRSVDKPLGALGMVNAPIFRVDMHHPWQLACDERCSTYLEGYVLGSDSACFSIDHSSRICMY